MFQKLARLLEQPDSRSDTLQLTVKRGAAGTLSVVLIIATPSPDQKAHTVSNLPLCVTGTPEELDAEFFTAVQQFVGSRATILEQAADSISAIQQASIKNATPSAVQPVSQNPKALPGKPKKEKPVSPQTDLLDFFGDPEHESGADQDQDHEHDPEQDDDQDQDQDQDQQQQNSHDQETL